MSNQQPHTARSDPPRAAASPYDDGKPQPLLTDRQIADASECQLTEAMRAISLRLNELDESAVFAAARRGLRELGLDDGVVIEVGVAEYDDGYFYEGVTRVVDESGSEPRRLSDDDRAVLARALDQPLETLSYNGRRAGRFSALRIDLIQGVLDT